MTGADLSAARERRALVLVLVGGVLIKVGFLFAHRHAPDFAQPWLDAHFHDWVARGLAFGEWAPPPDQPDPRVDETAWARPPLYPALLALIYKLSDGSYVAPRLAQLGLGLLTALGTYHLALRLAPKWPAARLFAAGLTLLSPTLLYFEGELVAAGPAALVLVGLALALLRLRERPTFIRAAAVASLVGVAVHLRPNLLALIPVVGVVLLWPRRGGLSWGRGASLTVVTAAVVGLLVMPVTLRNADASGELVLLSTNGPITLLHGNHPDADGTTMSLPPVPELRQVQQVSPFGYTRLVSTLGRALGEREFGHSEASAHFTELATSWMKAEPGAFLALTAKKALLLLGPDEVSNNKQVALEMEANPVVRWLPARWWLLAALALVGAWVVFARRPRQGASGVDRLEPAGEPPDDGPLDEGDGRPLPALVTIGALLACTLVPLLPFLAASRFRAPVVPLLAALAGVGAAALWRAARTERSELVPRLGALAVGLVLFFPSFTGYEPDAVQWRLDRAQVLLRAGDREAARAELARARERAPDHPEVRVTLGYLQATGGDLAGAREHFAAALRARPDHLQARAQLGAALLALGQAEPAAEHLGRVVERSPADAAARFNYALALERLGRLPEARAQLQETLRLAPELQQARAAMARIMTALSQGRAR